MKMTCYVFQLLMVGILAGHLAPARRSALWIFAAATVGVGVAVVAVSVALGH